jgi:hypothetical protein
MRVNTIAFHPQATIGMSEKLFGNLVTGSSDGKIFFWQMDLGIILYKRNQRTG